MGLGLCSYNGRTSQLNGRDQIIGVLWLAGTNGASILRRENSVKHRADEPETSRACFVIALSIWEECLQVRGEYS